MITPVRWLVRWRPDPAVGRRGRSRPASRTSCLLADDLGWADCSPYGGRRFRPRTWPAGEDGMALTPRLRRLPELAPRAGRRCSPGSTRCATGRCQPQPPRADLKSGRRTSGTSGNEVSPSGRWPTTPRDGIRFGPRHHFRYHADDCVEPRSSGSEAAARQRCAAGRDQLAARPGRRRRGSTRRPETPADARGHERNRQPGREVPGRRREHRPRPRAGLRSGPPHLGTDTLFCHQRPRGAVPVRQVERLRRWRPHAPDRRLAGPRQSRARPPARW